MDTDELLKRYAAGDRDFRHVEPQIAATVQYLRRDSPLLDLVTIQVAQTLIQIHGQALDQQLTSDTILTHLKSLVRDLFETNHLWEESAREIWSSLTFRAIEDMQRDLGASMLESLDWAAFNRALFQYLFSQDATVIINRINYLEKFYAQKVAAKIVRDLDLTHQPLSTLKRVLRFSSLEPTTPISELPQEVLPSQPSLPETLISLSTVNHLATQLQIDLWQSQVRNIAYARYQTKQSSNPYYLEQHIISSEDIQTILWDIAKHLLQKLGLDAVKLHLYFAAQSLQQIDPWNGCFPLEGTEIMAELGWDQRDHSGLVKTSHQLASLAHSLSCLLVKAIWLGQSHGNTHTPVGRLWDVLVTPDGEFDWQTGTINPPYAIGLTISPGLWISDFLHRGERKAEVVLYQFSYCALHLLKLHPDDSEFAIRLVIHLRLDARLQACDSRPYEYQVQSLLSAVLPESLLHQIQESSEVARFWFDRWNRVLGLLGTLGWHTDESRLLPDRDLESVTRFYTKPYPKWLEPDSDQRRPRGWVDCWLGQTLVLRPPVLLPEQMSALIHGSREQHSLLKLSRPYQLTGAEVKAARQSRKLTQSELAELLQVHQSLIARIESGDRAISPAIEALLRKTLELS